MNSADISGRTEISIHSLRMEGDYWYSYAMSEAEAFQSTPSAWRETWRNAECRIPKKFQSTPSAWRETPSALWERCSFEISIHSLRMEGDGVGVNATIYGNVFQSTPSAWRETDCQIFGTFFHNSISIHSLRMEGDSILPGDWIARNHFNPLPPHGGRLESQYWSSKH